MLGIFAKTYPYSDPTTLAQAIAADGFTGTQLNCSALGIATIPEIDRQTSTLLQAAADAFARAGVALCGVSATYNMAHPDAAQRHEMTARAAAFISALGVIRPGYISLCTGTRHPSAQWTAHPANTTPAAWRDFRASLDTLLAASAGVGIPLAIEPEPGNIIADVAAASRLIRELGADCRHIRWIFDPANLVHQHHSAHHRRILQEAEAVIGDRWCCVHLKDTVPWAQTITGRGEFDFSLLNSCSVLRNPTFPVIIQDAAASEGVQIKKHLEYIMST